MDRFWSKVQKSNNCWIWKAYIKPNGYGTFRLGSRKVYAHRHAYELINGTIHPGLVIDHTCENTACVNPNHLEAITQRDNLLRGATLAAIESAKTHCSNGHLFNLLNTYRYKNKRMCRTCRKELYRKR